LRASLTEINGEECDPSISGSPLSSAEQDISDFVKWGYKRGQFPLTPEGLLQMKFDHTEHPTPPKHAFPAAILLFVCIKRNDAEEACFQNLLREWGFWFVDELPFEIPKNGPPKRLQFSADEIDWCKVKLDYLVRKITSESDRERLGLPPLKKVISKAAEAAALLPSSGSQDNGVSAAQSSLGSKPARGEEDASATAAVDTEPQAAPAPSVGGASGGGIAEKEESSEARKKPARRKRGRSAAAAAAEGTPAKRVKGAKKEDTPVNNEDKILVRATDGKRVSAKDGRIVAAGNDLKETYTNTYRNAENTRAFHGKQLTLGEAFKLASLVNYGPTMPIDRSGHLKTREALFRTAAYYALTDQETKQIMDHPDAVDFYFFLVKAAKNLVYAYHNVGRLVFGDAVLGMHPPTKLLQGTSNIISVNFAPLIRGDSF
jgi:hypothetical protein